MLLCALLLSVAAVPCERQKAPLKRAACERQAGHVLAALDAVEQQLQRKPRDRRALALRTALEAEVVTVRWFSEPDGALVSIDGADPAGSTPLTVRLDPGEHRFHFTHDGYGPLDRTERAVSGTRPTLTAVLEKTEPAPPTQGEAAAPAPTLAPATALPDAPSPASPAAARVPPSRSSAPYVLGGTGIAIAIGGGVLTYASYLQLQAAHDRGAELRAALGYGLVGIGVALGIAAIVWLLVERPPGVPAPR